MICLKKIPYIMILLLLTILLLVLGFDHKNQYEPNTFYQVYLQDEVLGVIRSKSDLEKYIDKAGETIKKDLGVSTVYAPNGIKIEKLTTYTSDVITVSDIYEMIQKRESFTVKGYQFTIRKKNEETGKETISYIYTTSKNIFTEATTEFLETYVGDNIYQAFINGDVVEINGTGRRTENIYIAESITVKERYIPTTEKIYTNSRELAQFLLFGNNIQKKEYSIKAGETLAQIAYNNEISIDELILSNPEFSKENFLVFAGQKITIGIPDPQLSAVLEEYVVFDQSTSYNTVEVYDNTINIGQIEVRQNGKNGVMRITQKTKTVNGIITYIDPVSKIELEPAVDKIVALGNRYVPSVGTVTGWRWPTDSGCTITSPYGYRKDPFTGKRSFHGAIDIAGLGYNANIYAVTNGVVYKKGKDDTNGYYITIDHNNGYYTQYNHMIRQSKLSVGATVAKGDVIGYIGSSGAATGPHVHFAVWIGIPFRGQRIDPMSMYPNPACT